MRISDWSSDVCSSDLTENAQPAIMANAIATLRVLEKEGGLMLADKADYVAGHSLGEYSALCGAQALDLATTSRLLKLRGRAMQAAVPVGRSEEHTSELPSLRRNSDAGFCLKTQKRQHTNYSSQ